LLTSNKFIEGTTPKFRIFLAEELGPLLSNKER